MSGTTRAQVLVVALGLAALGQPTHAAPTAVDPAELAKRADLVGKEVVVDDRLVYFQYHKGQGYDEVVLRRAGGVGFKLPGGLRPAQPPRVACVRIRGILERAGDDATVQVTAMDLLPDDLTRLEQAIEPLPPGESEARAQWGRWARDRARVYKDDNVNAALNARLEARGRVLQAEALRIDADRKGVADPVAHWFGLADRAKMLGLPAVESAALVHRAARASLGSARGTKALVALAEKVENLLPEAGRAASADVSAWLEAYDRDPAEAYRSAPAEVRAALDRRLLTDARTSTFRARAAEAPGSALDLADEAASNLPDRPELAAELRRVGMKAVSEGVGKLRQNEVRALAARFREKLRQPEKADELLRAWLDVQRREKLRPGDAEGRISLAELYRSWLNDTAAAASLLQGALAIDPKSKEAANAFRRMGYRKVEDRWVAPTVPAVTSAAPAEEPAAAASGSIIERDMTRAQVRTRLGGKPDRIARVATQGQVIEQWTYIGPKSKQVINFRQQAGRSQPTVWSYYSLP